MVQDKIGSTSNTQILMIECNWSKKSKAINWWTNGRAIIDLLSKVDGEDERPQSL